MKKLIFSLLIMFCLIYDGHSQTLRMVMGSGAGKNFTLGQTFVGYSSGNPNKLWQGFWVPKNVVSSIKEETFNSQSISKIYPNPASSFINIESNETIQSIQLYTLNGEVVYEGNTSQITLDNFASNLYIVKVIHSSGIINVHKLLIAR